MRRGACVPSETWGSHLPSAWRAAVRCCPFCAGLGTDEGRDCIYCEGTGDLMGTLLRQAYTLGRADALHHLAKVREYVESAERLARENEIDVRELKRSMGL
jgi:hypothetical protein